MKRGTEVAVCHDGKWGRRVKGVVVATKQGSRILVRFPHPEDGSDVEFWARVRPTIHYQRRSRRGKYSCIITLNNYKHYAGWADIDYFCPWFSVYKWKEHDEHE